MPKTIKLPGSCLSNVRLWGALVLLSVAGGVTNMAQAATTLLGPVDSSADEADALVGDGVCKATGGNYCTLRAAIQESNALFAKGITDITITVNAGTYFLGLTGAKDDDAAATGDLDILGTCPSADINLPCLKIEGSGRGSTLIDGGGVARVFHFVGKNTVKITGVTIQNGSVTDDNGGGIKNSNGWVTLENCEIINNTVSTTGARYSGGGIYSAFGGRMVINRCTISGNKVNNTAGIKADDYIFGVGGGGGGISNVGVMTIRSTTIQDNLGRPLGGGIMNVSGFVGESGKLTIISSTLQGNKNAKDDGSTPNGVGGALSNQGGLLSINQSIISGNIAREGGGIFNTNGAAVQGTISGSMSIISSLVDGNIGNGLSNKDAMEVRYTTISNNVAQPFEACADGSGGCTNGADGGGINSYGPGELMVENSTITSNTARNGGGINNGRAMTLTSITISDNTATNVGGGKEIFINIQDIARNPGKFKSVLLSNIIGGNGAASVNNCSGGTVDNSGNTTVDSSYPDTITSKGYNLENGNSCGLGAGDLNANPNLGALADNGGGTQTILPGGVYPKNFMPGSPAIGNGACPSPSLDQRQFGRPGPDNKCDIGAVESDGDRAVNKVDLDVQKTANVPTVVRDGLVIYTLTVTNNGPNIAEGVTLKDRLPAGVTYAGWARPVPETNPPGVGCVAPTASADFTCTLASLAPGVSFTVYLTVKVTDGSLIPTDPSQVRTIENMASVSTASPIDYLPGNNGSLTSCVRGACAVTRVLMGDGVTNFTPSGGGGVFGPWALLLLGVPGLFLMRRRM